MRRFVCILENRTLNRKRVFSDGSSLVEDMHLALDTGDEFQVIALTRAPDGVPLPVARYEPGASEAYIRALLEDI